MKELDSFNELNGNKHHVNIFKNIRRMNHEDTATFIYIKNYIIWAKEYNNHIRVQNLYWNPLIVLGYDENTIQEMVKDEIIKQFNINKLIILVENI